MAIDNFFKTLWNIIIKSMDITLNIYGFKINLWAICIFSILIFIVAKFIWGWSRD